MDLGLIRTRTLVSSAIAVIVVVSALVFFIGIRPSLSAASTAKAQTETSLNGIASLASKAAQVKKDIDGYDDMRAAYESAFPSSFSQGEFVSDAYTLATSTGVSLLSISPNTPQLLAGSKTAASSDVTISVSGTLEQVSAFLSGIENARRPLVVSRVTVGASPGQAEQMQIQGTLLLVNATAHATPAPTATAPANPTSVN